MHNYATINILLNDDGDGGDDDDDEEEEEEEEEEGEVKVLVIDFKWEDILNHRGCKEHFSDGFGLQGAAENIKDIV
jgi:hypothetical protein